jgi:hypothetical protein
MPFDAALLTFQGHFRRLAPEYDPTLVTTPLHHPFALSNCELKSSNKPFPFESG